MVQSELNTSTAKTGTDVITKHAGEEILLIDM